MSREQREASKNQLRTSEESKQESQVKRRKGEELKKKASGPVRFLYYINLSSSFL